MDDLSKFEKQEGIILPKHYKNFYQLCVRAVPKKLTGTDLFNYNWQLKQWAKELLEEDGADNFLNEDDFVFMMHQGYIFWYFKADGDENPIVYGYHEGKLIPDKIDKFSVFMKDYI